MKRILLFGSSQTGKSSLANVAFGAVFEEGPRNGAGCTFKTQTHGFGNGRIIYDTAGLSENKVENKVSAVQAIGNLAKLQHDMKDGLHAIVMVKTRSVVSETERLNAEIVHKHLFSSKPRLICAVTHFDGCSLTEMNEWKKSSEDYYKKVLGCSHVVPCVSKRYTGTDTYQKRYYDEANMQAAHDLRKEIDDSILYSNPYTAADGVGMGIWQALGCYVRNSFNMSPTEFECMLISEGVPAQTAKAIRDGLVDSKMKNYPIPKWFMEKIFKPM
jgi:hypothetical protein